MRTLKHSSFVHMQMVNITSLVGVNIQHQHEWIGINNTLCSKTVT